MTVYIQRYAQVAAKLLGAVGGEGMHGLSPELLLGVILEMDRPEHQLLGDTRLIMLNSGPLGAVAAQTNQVLVSSSSPGTLTVITHIYSKTNTAMMGIVAGAGFSAAVANAVKHRDARAGGTPGTTLHTKNAAGLLVSIAATRINPGVWVEVNFVQITGAPKAPGTICIENETVNQTLEVYMLGYERPADQHEYDGTVS